MEAKAPVVPKLPAAKPATATTSGAAKKAEKKYKVITLRMGIDAPAQLVYDVFVTPERLSALTMSTSIIEPKAEGTFKMFVGNVTGHVVKAVASKSFGNLLDNARVEEWAQDIRETVFLAC